MSTAKRKLAAIVFADIAGYTDKTNQDESSALASRDRVERLIKASTLSHNGRLIKTMGDGAMLEFASAVEAVSCALDIQDQMDHLNQELELPEPIAVRVGVHVGDVVEEENDLYGNAVNIASRVHAMAKPGGICITREVYVQIRPILKLQCTPVPGASSDRMPEKVEVFAVLGEEISGSSSTRRPLKKAFIYAGIAVVLVMGILWAVMSPMFRGSSTASTLGETATENSHRLLLPDWVTPGEWFTLDAGAHTSDLAVYFGNRKADTKIEDGKLLVQTPQDIPTEQTTIAVFQGSNSDAMMRQQTQVIRYGALAMNSPKSSMGAFDEKGPEIKIDSASLKADEKKEAPPQDPPKPPQTGSPPPVYNPPTAAPKNSKSSNDEKSLIGSNPDYNALVTSIGDDLPHPSEFQFKELKMLPPTFGNAMKAMTFAQSGNKEKAQNEIRKVRLDLKGKDPEIVMETESILKATEAILSEGIHGERRVMVGSRPKFAEAFAFSINRGTRSLPGILFVDQQIRDNKPAEARRALDLLKSRPDLTPSEKKAIDKLEARLKKLGETASAPKPSTQGSESS